ncbi:pyruvate dehydrogenase complex dihydrolipoamide acetyltransferase [Nonlabens spongiae]|uniref:Acetyltransferase component of pyruvate dehydrogenase complex n=1 Tax=Nonlabens spongiae TaxID=331648 RepID=A0A1W6MLE8_9FLAO|nr:pyruvate dehydrogenase complex dihydrolipoamide acetyltransferase [Nonlabens spongiae]ARN78402.1 pyruvate dehydrogenase complex dihydrolipoamide acetyltransferase [Nonlabens spongiae]
MAEIINMPRLSDTMEEGVVATWLKQVGDKVEEGDILAEIETDKATMEFESFSEGTLLHIGVQEGETAPVDQLLCIIGEEGEDISNLLDGKGSDSNDDSENKKENTDSDSEDDSEDQESDEDDSEKESESEESNDDASGSEDLPEGVVIVTMPRLSDTMEEGTVATWLKQEGDQVEEGDILAEIETDKATMEFESFESGTLLKIGIQEGETAKVDALLAILGPEGTDVSNINTDSADKPAKTEKKESRKSEPKEKNKEEKKEEPKAQKSEPKKTTEPAQKQSSSNDSGRVFASPLAKKMAEEKGIKLSDVQGSGENGRIVKSDIENYTPSANSGSAAGAPSYQPVGEESFEEIPNSQMRKTIAKRLGQSKFTAPHYYLGLDLDMDNAIASRKAINELPDTKISFNDMVIKAAAMALRKHPKVNTQWTDKNTIVAKHIHVGVAVAVEDGLLVPVLPFADQMSMQQIGAKVKELAGKARNKKLQPKEMEGSTFTISNLGMFGITEFTSIINQPNSAIMSVGAIVQKPVVKDGQMVIGNVMKVTLACDHRTVDGATGAAFLQTFKSYIENPIVMYV